MEIVNKNFVVQDFVRKKKERFPTMYISHIMF